MKYEGIVRTLHENNRMDIIAKSSCILPNNHLHNTVQNFGGHTCIDIGTYKGLSAVAMASSFRKIFTFDVLYQPDADEVFKMFGFENKIRYKYQVTVKDPETVTDYREYSKIYGPKIRKEINKIDFQFAFVDACHEIYEEVQKDFEAVKKCGVVLFHDYRESFPETKRFCNDIGCEPLGEFALWQK